MIDEKPLTTGDIADHCHVSHRAVLKWIEGGKLKAYKTPGKHSRVSVEDFHDFLKEYDMPIPEEIEEEIRRLSQRRKRILIVDDDETMIKTIHKILSLEEKYEFETARDGFEAGQKFCALRPDLITLDLRMPNMDGYEVCRRIRANPKNEHVKILVVSAYLDGDEPKKVMDLGADDYLMKPISSQALKEKIQELLSSDK